MDVDEALTWLADVAHENLGTEIDLRTSDGWSRGFARRPDGSLAGVSTHSPGQWFLEAESPAATADLVAQVADDAQRAGGWPAKVTTSGVVKQWLRPLLAAHGVVPVREHDLLAMACHKPPGNGEGRWATPTDRPTLEQYQTLYNAERRTTIAPDWDNLLRRRSVAVLERGGRNGPPTPPALPRSEEPGRIPRAAGAAWRSESPHSSSANCCANVPLYTSWSMTTTCPPSPSTGRCSSSHPAPVTWDICRPTPRRAASGEP